MTRYVGLFSQGDAFADGLERVVSAMIQSPYFLYRRELGTGAIPGELSSHELASALAFSLTGLPPDEELNQLADSGALMEDDQWKATVSRLLSSTQGEAEVTRFVTEWLGLDRVLTHTKTEGDFDVEDSLRTAMLAEATQFTKKVFRGEGDVAELLYSNSTFLNAELASFYGISSGENEDWAEVSLVGSNRVGGLLGQGAFLLGHSTPDSSSPTLRGKVIRERLLCQVVPPPPPTVNVDLPVSESLTTRDRLQAHVADPVCAGCHQALDPLGFGFEHYDGLGRYRDLENGVAVDATGEIVQSGADSVPFNGLAELLSLLAEDEEVRGCFAEQYVEYTLGQKNWDGLCSVNRIENVATMKGGSIKDYLRSVLEIPHFRMRVPQGEQQ